MTVKIAVKPKVAVAAQIVNVVKAAPGLEFPATLIENLIAKYDAFQKAKKKAETAEKDYRPVEDDVRETVAAAKLDPVAEVQFVFDKRTITIGKQKQVTEFIAANGVIVEKLNKVKAGLADELMKFKLEDLRTYLTPDELALIIKSEDIGPRGVKVK